MNASSLTRSDFVKGGAALGMAGALGMGATFSSRSDRFAYATEAEGVAWDKEADIVVLGCGACGMVAAIEAAELGASVIAVEKNDGCGGDAYYSHGVVMGNGSRMDEEKGIEVTSQQVIDEANDGWYLMEQPQIELSDFTIEQSGATLNWLLDHGVQFDNPEGHLNHTYSDLPIFHQMVGWGTGLIALADQLEGKVDELLLGTRAKRLVQDESGRVIGVVCEGSEGSEGSESSEGEVAIKARCGVVLATGGYNHNNALVTLWDNRCEGMLAQGCPTNTGDGLIMAAACGAAYMSARAEAPTSCLLDMSSVNYASFALPREGAICVGVDGRRFMLESSELKRINTDMAIEQYVDAKRLGSEYVCYICTECDAIQDTIADGVTTFKADTLEELAEQLGVDPSGLVEEVAHYNEMVAAGKDEDFGKEEGLIALDTAPFYGIQVTPRLNQSCGGLIVNTDSQVMSYQLDNEEGIVCAPIPGLYAGGEIVPYSMHYGFALSHAFTQGRIAVRHALGIQG